MDEEMVWESEMGDGGGRSQRRHGGEVWYMAGSMDRVTYDIYMNYLFLRKIETDLEQMEYWVFYNVKGERSRGTYRFIQCGLFGDKEVDERGWKDLLIWHKEQGSINATYVLSCDTLVPYARKILLLVLRKCTNINLKLHPCTVIYPGLR